MPEDIIVKTLANLMAGHGPLGKSPPITPPVEPPKEEEIFPGFQLHVSEIGKQKVAASTRLEAAEKGLARIQAAGVPHPLSNVWGFKPPEGYISSAGSGLFKESAWQEELLKWQTEVNEALNQYQGAAWRESVLYGLPLLYGDPDTPVRSAQDVMNAYPLATASAGDEQWVESLVKAMSAQMVQPTEQAIEAGMTREQFLDDLLDEPDLDMRAVHNLTVDELTRSFRTGPSEVVSGMDWDDISDILKDDPEYLEYLQDIRAQSEEFQNQWKEQAAAVELIRAGAAQAEIPSLAMGERFKMMITQPALAIYETMVTYSTKFAQPWAAWNIINNPLLKKTSAAVELDKLHKQYTELGVGSWEAHSRAFEEWDTNIFLKIFIEIALDPTTYIGWGLATKVTKGIPYVGRFVGAFERGWNSAFNLPFLGITKLISKIPKTPFQRSVVYARTALKDTKAYLQRFQGHDWVGLTNEQLVNAMRFSLKAIRETPQGSDWPHRVGRYLTEHDLIPADTIQSWYAQVGHTVDVTKEMVLDVNEFFEYAFRGVNTPTEMAETILKRAGIDPNAKDIKRMAGTLNSQVDEIFKTADSLIISGATPKAKLQNFMKFVEDMHLIRLNNPLNRTLEQSGKITAWAARATDKFVRNSAMTKIDRYFTSPLANQYLLFTNYGPYNFLENMVRSFNGSGQLMYPRTSSPVDEAVRYFGGLIETPFEFTGMGGSSRLEMAIIDPVTGKLNPFEGGKIPYLTRAGKWGPTITLGTKEYPLRSAMDWNRMFGDIGESQRAWYMVTRYKQELGLLAPEQVEQIGNIFAKHQATLEKVGFFDNQARKDIIRVLEQDATVGPNSVRAHAIPITELEGRKALLEVNKSLDRCSDIYSIHKNTIRNEILNGRMWKDIDGTLDKIANSIREMDVMGLQVEIEAINTLTKEMASFVPKTGDDVLRTMGFISDISEATAERISEVRSITRARASGLYAQEREKFHNVSAELLGNFLDTSKVRVDDIMSNFRRTVSKSGLLDESQSEVMEQLAKVIEERHANALSARVKDRELINRMMTTTPAGKRDMAWWDLLDSRRTTEVWDNYWVNEKRLFKSSEKSKRNLMNAMGQEVAPPPVITEIDQLTPAHVAYLFQTTNDNLNKALTKVGAMTKLRPKAHFVSWVKEAAEEMAATVGKTADNIGFTDDAISDVYEQMLRSLGIDPGMAATEPLIPAMGQLEEVRGVLHTQFVNRRIPEGDYLNYKKYITDVADDLGELPMYKIAAKEVPIDRDTTIRTAVERGEKTVIDPMTGQTIDLGSYSKKRLIHYSRTENLDTISPEFQYTGMSGSEKRFHTEYASHFKKGWFAKRSYFYSAESQVEKRIKTGAAARYETDEILKTFDSVTATQAEWDLFDKKKVQLLKKFRKEFGANFGNLQQQAAEVDFAALKSLGYDAFNNPERGLVAFKEIPTNRPAGLATTDVLPVDKSVGAARSPESDAWWALKEQAMKNTRLKYELDFTDYNNDNMIDAAMKMVFPFWTYETQRYIWMPRAMLTRPGLATGMGRYMDNTDQGYIPVPGTDIQFNALRGTVMAGGMRRLMLRDYPEYYDAMPGMEIIDAISRFGFYPGAHVMFPIVAFGALQGKPEWGEIAPAWFKTGLDAARAISPEAAGRVIDHIFPDRFRDYLTMLTLGAAGHDADEIWNKKKSGKALTEEEERLWLQAESKATGLKGVLFEQSGVFRVRPQEYTQMQTDMKQIIADMTGIPIRVQEAISRRYPVTGKRLTDYYDLNILEQKMIYEQEAYERFKGMTTPLYPSGWQELDVRISNYYSFVDKLFKDIRHVGLYDRDGVQTDPSIIQLNEQMVNRDISPEQWKNIRGDIMTKAAAITQRVSVEEYPDVPLSLDEREAYYIERNIIPPTRGPSQELLYMYYELQPEKRYDWESGKDEWDFDTYYGQVDALIESLDEKERQTFLARIQYEWTPMEKLYWTVSREYLKPYRLMRNMVSQQYSEDERRNIRRFESARGEERARIQALPGPGGQKLISGYQAALRDARQKLRLAQPELDAWLYFWGATDTFLTAESEELYNENTAKYLQTNMIK